MAKKLTKLRVLSDGLKQRRKNVFTPKTICEGGTVWKSLQVAITIANLFSHSTSEGVQTNSARKAMGLLWLQVLFLF